MRLTTYGVLVLVSVVEFFVGGVCVQGGGVVLLL